MEPARAKMINNVVRISADMIADHVSDFERMAKTDVSQWSKEDQFAARGVILSMLSIIRGDMIRYLPEDGSETRGMNRINESPAVRRARSVALSALMEKVPLLTELANRDPELPRTPKENNIMSAAVFAFLIYVTEGTITE